MKGWLVGLALFVVVVASGVGLWITWDSTQTSSADPVVAASNQALTNRTTTTSAVSPPTTVAVPGCEPADQVVTGDPNAEWSTMVIDPAHRLPDSYAPPDLVDATAAGFESRDQVRAIVVEDLAALRSGAEANGSPIAVISGYRSFDYQRNLFQDRVDEVGDVEAALRTARPGHSEHQLGTAIDVLEPGVGELTTDFALTAAGQWLAAHAHEYGFVISYPDGQSERSCYEYEPWHLRYVGRETAAAIHDAGTTPREWMFAQGNSDG